ncbi:hypothetical protein B0H11DRAFT_1918680 [Mycena galericulata]|nr:hypothetical protein B0H11DRAFT_1918680 [Mycena galericulata]
MSVPQPSPLTAPPTASDSRSPQDLTQYQVMQVSIRRAPLSLQKRDEQRRKTRERMVRHRLKLKSAPPEQQEASRQRAREARARYREKNRIQLMIMSRARRIEEFGHKFGMVALEAKFEKNLERKRLKIEKKRRKGRISAPGKPISNKRRREAELSSDEEDPVDAPLRPPRNEQHQCKRKRRPPPSDEEDPTDTPLRPPRNERQQRSSGSSSSSSQSARSSNLGQSRPERKIRDSSSDTHHGREVRRQERLTLGRVRRAPGTPTPKGVRDEEEDDEEDESSSSDSSDEDAPISFPSKYQAAPGEVDQAAVNPFRMVIRNRRLGVEITDRGMGDARTANGTVEATFQPLASANITMTVAARVADEHRFYLCLNQSCEYEYTLDGVRFDVAADATFIVRAVRPLNRRTDCIEVKVPVLERNIARDTVSIPRKSRPVRNTDSARRRGWGRTRGRTKSGAARARKEKF